MTTANLAVADNEAIVQYTSIGESAFTFPFPILSTDELKVSVDQVDKTLAVDYTVSGVGDSTGGTVTFLTATTAGEKITIWLEMPIARATGFPTGAAVLKGSDLNTEFARETRLLQMLRRDVARCLRLPIDDTVARLEMELPAADQRKGKYMRFSDATGEPEMADVTASTTVLSQSVIANLFWPQSTEELNAGITPTSLFYPYRDVRRWGYVGDGVTDETHILTKANALGGNIYIPYGTLLYDASVDFTNQVRIRGDGRLTVLKPSGNSSSGGTIKLSAAESEILDVHFDWSNLNDYQGLEVAAVRCRVRCTESDMKAGATDNTGDTDGSTAVITGMTDTSDFNVGGLVAVSAGFASTDPIYEILSKTANSITVNANSNSAQNNVTVSNGIASGNVAGIVVTAANCEVECKARNFANTGATNASFCRAVSLNAGAHEARIDLEVNTGACGLAISAGAERVYIKRLIGRELTDNLMYNLGSIDLRCEHFHGEGNEESWVEQGTRTTIDDFKVLHKDGAGGAIGFEDATDFYCRSATIIDAVTTSGNEPQWYVGARTANTTTNGVRFGNLHIESRGYGMVKLDNGVVNGVDLGRFTFDHNHFVATQQKALLEHDGDYIRATSVEGIVRDTTGAGSLNFTMTLDAAYTAESYFGEFLVYTDAATNEVRLINVLQDNFIVHGGIEIDGSDRGLSIGHLGGGAGGKKARHYFKNAAPTHAGQNGDFFELTVPTEDGNNMVLVGYRRVAGAWEAEYRSSVSPAT